MFVKGYKQTKSQQYKIKNSRISNNGNGFCVFCGKKISLYSKKQKTCGGLTCKRLNGILNYNSSKTDPLLHKAKTLSGSIRLGKGKIKKMFILLKQALGNKCVYCSSIITLENASLDHKISRKHSKVYSKSKKTMTYTPEEIRELDKLDNLQIICKKCNAIKSDFTHEQFKRLSDFLDINEDIKDVLRIRLNRGVLLFRRRF